jgi:anti-anti-sigma factor
MNASLKSGRTLAVELGSSYPSIDRSQLQALSRRLLSLLDERGLARLLVDMSRTEHFGAGLVGVLARAMRQAEANGQEVVICGADENALEIFRITRLDRRWPIYASKRNALRDLGNPRVSNTVAA